VPKTSREDLLKLLIKELDYQVSIFGDYSDDKSLNIASLILIIEVYLKKAKKAYVAEWKFEKPDWLSYAKEQGDTNLRAVPVGAYEELIKVFALAGAALESFSQINPNEWREDGIKNKWISNLGGSVCG